MVQFRNKHLIYFRGIKVLTDPVAETSSVMSCVFSSPPLSSISLSAKLELRERERLFDKEEYKDVLEPLLFLKLEVNLL